jgi:hypothetical protein
MSNMEDTNLGHSSVAHNGRRTAAVAAAEIADFELSEVRDSLRGLRYGAVEIIVQDGVIVQINRTEKRRFGQRAARH